MSDVAEVKVTPDEEKIKEIVEEAIKDKLKEQFNLGMIAGWDAAIRIIYQHCGTMTSANKIKKYLKSKLDESKNRVNNLKEE